MAPDRAYRASERGSSQFYDARRVQLPAWKPAGVGWCKVNDSPPWIFAPKKIAKKQTTPNSVFDKELGSIYIFGYFWFFALASFGLVWSGLVCLLVCLFVCLFMFVCLFVWCLFLLGFVFGASASSSFTLLDGNHFLPFTLRLKAPESLAVSCRGPKGKKVVFQTSSFKVFPVKLSGLSHVFASSTRNPLEVQDQTKNRL